MWTLTYIAGLLTSLFRWIMNRNNNENALVQAETSIELQELPGEKTNELETLRIDCKNLQARNEELQRQLHEKEKDWKTLKMDFDDLRTRLSEMGAMQLTEGNPNITDLSDQNRPDKTAEQFSELYDNQWTDCYMVLMDRLTKSEQEAIETLLTIVKTVYDISLNRSQEIMCDVRKALVTFAGMSDEESEKGLDSLIQETLHKMKSYRTKHFKAVPNYIAKEINEKLVATIGEQEVTACSEYIDECVRICWLMSIKDPPMYIFCEKEDVFNKNHFMEYTEKGHKVSYIVWPVLYLYKNGPLMRKGVAQGEGKHIEYSNVAATEDGSPKPNAFVENNSQISTGTSQIVVHCNGADHVETECSEKNEHSLESKQTRVSRNNSEDISVQEQGSEQHIVTVDIISTVAECNASNKGEAMHLVEADDSDVVKSKCQDVVISQTENDTFAESPLQDVIEGVGKENSMEGNETHVTDEEQSEHSEDTVNGIKSCTMRMNRSEESSHQSQETRNQAELYHTNGDVVSKDKENDTSCGDKEDEDKIALKDQAEEQVKSPKTDITNAKPLYIIEDQGSRTSSTEAEAERQVEEDREDDRSCGDKEDEDKVAVKNQAEEQVKSPKTDVTNAKPLYNIDDQGSRTSSTEAEAERQVEEDREDDRSCGDKEDEDKVAVKNQAEEQVKSPKTDVTNAKPLYNIDDQGSRTSSTEAEAERQVEEDREDDRSCGDKEDEDKVAVKNQAEEQVKSPKTDVTNAKPLYNIDDQGSRTSSTEAEAERQVEEDREDDRSCGDKEYEDMVAVKNQAEEQLKSPNTDVTNAKPFYNIDDQGSRTLSTDAEAERQVEEDREDDRSCGDKEDEDKVDGKHEAEVQVKSEDSSV
ncbi:hypothetical protein ACJMK2_031864 [Sinanodonta woodiana]|uniref:Mitochondria-eating protein n=1 Tax=Sinanodonta woodiana TaxID=1069815 RepID=A0ABD3X1I8_SINWO